MVGEKPIARILRKSEINRMEPLFEKSEEINKVFGRAEQIDNRKGLDEFDRFDDAVGILIDALLTEWEVKGESPNFYRKEEFMQ